MTIKNKLIKGLVFILFILVGETAYCQAPIATLPTCIGTATGSTAYITITNYPGSGTYSLAYSAPSPLDPNKNNYSNFLLPGNCPISSVSGTTCKILITVSSTSGLPAMGNYVLTYTNAAGSSGSGFNLFNTSLNMNSVSPPILTITGNGITNTVQSTSPSTPNTANALIGYDCIPLSSTPSSTLVLSVTQPGTNSYSWSFGTSDGSVTNGWTSTQATGSTAPYTVINSSTLTISNFNNQPGLIKLTVSDGCNNAVIYTYIISRFLPSSSGTSIPNNLYPGLIQFDKTCTTAGVPITAYTANTQINNPGSLPNINQNLQANLNNFLIYGPTGWICTTLSNGVTQITPPASTPPGSYTITALLNATVSNAACTVNMAGTRLNYIINVLPVVSITGNTSSLSSGSSTVLTASPVNCSGCTYNWAISSGGGSFYYPVSSTSNTAVYISNGSPATITATYNTGSCTAIGSLAVGPYAPPSAYSSTGVVNYVRTIIAKRPIVNEADILSNSMTSNDVFQITSYYDGLGRPIQNVAKQASPAGNDMISSDTYDPWGREIEKYLPFTSNAVNGNDLTNDGNFKIDAFQQEVAFYNNQLSGQPNETNVGSNNLNWAFSKINYESSPLNRVTKMYAPGANWAGSENTSTPHNIQQEYLVNTAIDNVQIWNIGSAQGSIPTNGGPYSAGELYKSITIDEMGHQTIEYKDLYGQVILKKQQLTATADNGLGSLHAGWLCTYYVYDDNSNLRFIITPAVIVLIDGSWNISQSNADELCYRYEYDLLNRMIIKKNPGTPMGASGEVWMVYDQRNRLVMQQDANMRSIQKWQYIQYDALDRPIATGLIGDATNYNNLNFHLNTASISTAYPNLSLYTAEVLSQTFYDNYSWMNTVNSSSLLSTIDATTNGTTNSNFTTISYNVAPAYAQPMTQSSMTRGLPTGTKVEILGSNGPQYIYTVKFCNSVGRTIQTQSINQTGGEDIGTVCYDFIGKPLQSVLSHNKGGGNPQTHIVASTMSYDVMGRLLTIKKAMNSTVNGVAVATPVTTIVSNQYDELGRSKIKTLGSNIENLTYDYNIRNWLLGINRNYVSGVSNSNYFGMELGYDNSVSVVAGANYATPQYTGNISGTIWKSKGDGIDRKYDYSYDNVNRLISAPFTQQNGSSWDVTAGIDFSMQLGYNGNPAYDANGNINSMQQNGFKINSSPPIDQLSYSYLSNGNNTNRLQQVTDNANDKLSVLGDFKYDPSTKATTDYTYDGNGNIISDNNKAISSIAYSYLNLPQLLTITNKGTIQYIYDAAGNKLQKITNENNATVNSVTTNITTTITYVGQFVYQSISYSNPQLSTLNSTDILQFVSDEEGRIRFKPSVGTGSTALPASFVFDYFIRDNLNNTRMVLTDEQQQDIYPAATLEGPIANSGSMSYIENQYYTINPNNIVSTSPNTTPPSQLAWYSSAQNINYPNYNSLQSNPSVPVPINNNPNLNTSQPSQYMYKLNGATGDKTGLGITLKVMSGDVVNIFGKSLYHNNVTDPPLNNNNPITGAILSFLTSFTGTGAVSSSISAHAASSSFPSVLNSTPNTSMPLNNVLNNVTTPTATPKAYINWILFDDQFKAVSNSSNFSPLNTTPDNVMNYDLTNMPTVNISKNGYLYVYCSNESNIDFYFDNLQVTQTRGRILEEAHYYPFGLMMAGISDKAWNKLPNKFHYQNNEMQNGEFSDGSGLEEYDFHARHYDQQLGTWHNQDPANQFSSPYASMASNPAFVDPGGRSATYATDAKLILAGPVGALGASLASGGHFDPNYWTSDWWKGAITADIIVAAAVIGVDEAAGGDAAVAAAFGTGAGANAAGSIASGASSGVLNSVAGALIGDLTSGQPVTTNQLFTASVTGAVTGAYSGLNPTASEVADNGGYYGMGLRTPNVTDGENEFSSLGNLTLYNLGEVTGGSAVSSLLNGSLKLNVPIGPLPFNLTFGEHQSLFQLSANTAELLSLGGDGVSLFNNVEYGESFQWNWRTLSPDDDANEKPLGEITILLEDQIFKGLLMDN